MTISNIDDFLKAKYTKVEISSIYVGSVPDRCYPCISLGASPAFGIWYTEFPMSLYPTGMFNTNFTGGEPFTGGKAGFYKTIPPPEPGKNKYFCGMATVAGGNSARAITPIDLIWMLSGFSASTGVFNINSRAFPARDNSGLASGYGYEVVIFPANRIIHSGAYITYTNTENVSNRTGTIMLQQSFVPPNTLEVINFALEPEDKGVKSIQTFSNIDQRVDNALLFVYRRLSSEAIMSTNNNLVHPLNRSGLVEIYTGTCLTELIDPRDQSLATPNPTYFRFVEL
jgi:hypothetical protein